MNTPLQAHKNSGQENFLISSQDFVHSFLDRMAMQNEAAISIIRIAFTLLALTRFLFIRLNSSTESETIIIHCSIVVLLSIFVIAFSVLLLKRYHSNKNLPQIWLISAIICEAIIWFSLLFMDILFPGDIYRGVLKGPDIAIVIIIVMIAGFRLSVKLALLGGIVNFFAVVVLAFIEYKIRLPSTYDWEAVSMWFLILITATSIGVSFAWRTRSVAVRGTLESLRAYQAHQYMRDLLHGHHDAQGMLSAIRLTIDQLLGTVDKRNITVANQIARLNYNLDAIASCMQQLKESADGSVNATYDIQKVYLNQAIEESIEAMKASLPNISITYTLTKSNPQVNLAGGKLGMIRILSNLLQNANKGNGRQSAHHINIKVRLSSKDVYLKIEDDGPGFSYEDIQFQRVVKPLGSGVGMDSVAKLVQASGGRFEIGRSNVGGSLITIRYPLV